jgi:hypothetical protein
MARKKQVDDHLEEARRLLTRGRGLGNISSTDSQTAAAHAAVAQCELLEQLLHEIRMLRQVPAD